MDGLAGVERRVYTMPSLVSRCTVFFVAVGAFCCGRARLCAGAEVSPSPAAFTDWKVCEKYRDKVVHPATTLKPGDLRRARENIRHAKWAKDYVGGLRSTADHLEKTFTREYLERLIEPATPRGVVS